MEFISPQNFQLILDAGCGWKLNTKIKIYFWQDFGHHANIYWELGLYGFIPYYIRCHQPQLPPLFTMSHLSIYTVIQTHRHLNFVFYTHHHTKIIVVCPCIRNGRSMETIWPWDTRCCISAYCAIEARTRLFLWMPVMVLATGTNTSFLDRLYNNQATTDSYM